MLSTPPAATAAELTEKRMFMLFPTPMFMGKLPDMSVCDRVEKKVRELQKSGKGRSSPRTLERGSRSPPAAPSTSRSPGPPDPDEWGAVPRAPLAREQMPYGTRRTVACTRAAAFGPWL